MSRGREQSRFWGKIIIQVVLFVSISVYGAVLGLQQAGVTFSDAWHAHHWWIIIGLPYYALKAGARAVKYTCFGFITAAVTVYLIGALYHLAYGFRTRRYERQIRPYPELWERYLNDGIRRDIAHGQVLAGAADVGAQVIGRGRDRRAIRKGGR